MRSGNRRARCTGCGDADPVCPRRAARPGRGPESSRGGSFPGGDHRADAYGAGPGAGAAAGGDRPGAAGGPGTRVVRLSAGFKVGAHWTSEQARRAIQELLRRFGCPLWWIGKALDQAERRPQAKLGNKPVESWGFIRQIVENWTQGDGSPGSPPGAKPLSRPGPPCPGPASRDPVPRPTRRPRGEEPEPALSELPTAELRLAVTELESAVAGLSSSPRLRLGEQLRTQLSQAQSLLAARERGGV